MAETKTREETQAESLQKIGKSALASLREMVAALECDYERLEELRDELTALAEASNDAQEAIINDSSEEAIAARKTFYAAEEAIKEWRAENGEELAELEEAANCNGEPCKDREDAEQRIREDPLSIRVRGDWYDLGDQDKGGGDPVEFEILLCTGGPAVRIIGEFGERNAIHRVYLQVQDWFTPWTDYYEEGISDVLETYCGCFCFDC